MCASGDNSADIELREVDLTVADNELLAADMNAHQASVNAGSVVVELTYNVWTGRWSYHGMRPDKSSGNNVRTVFDTLEVCSENITEEELCYRVVKTPDTDHWQRKMTDALRQMTRATAAHAHQQQQQRQKQRQ